MGQIDFIIAKIIIRPKASKRNEMAGIQVLLVAFMNRVCEFIL